MGEKSGEQRKIREAEGELLWRSNVLGSLEIKSNGHLSYLLHCLGTGNRVSPFLPLA